MTVTRTKWLAEHAKKRRKVMALRKQGNSMERIGEILGFSRQRVSQIIAKEKKAKAVQP